MGAGVAGLTLAHQLIDTGLSVVVVESGEWEPDTAAQELAEAELDSLHYTRDAVSAGRRRQFGGTANAWTHVTKPGSGRVYARSLTAEAIDFDTKPWQREGGWPITLDELQPWYDQAQRRWTRRGTGALTERAVAARPPLPLAAGALTTRVADYGPSDVFTVAFRDDLVTAANTEVLVGSTVVALETDRRGSTVETAVVVRSDGTRLRVRAATFVLAGGGVENVQLLLTSDVGAPGGQGNRHDTVGRYLTDHPEFRMGTIVPADPGLIDAIGLYDMHWVDGAMVSGLLTLSQEVKRAEDLLNVGAVLIPQPAAFGTPAERALRVLHSVATSPTGGSVPAAFRALAEVVTAPKAAAAVLQMRAAKRRGDFDYGDGFVWHRGGWSRPGYDRRRFGVVEVHAATEQSPHRENRIHLTDQRDRLGRRRVGVRLHWAKDDYENIGRSIELFGREIEASGIGRFERWVQYTGSQQPMTTGLHHPMGGTRMSEDPRTGVVDADCRVHGTRNLFVAGSSTFSTGLGYSNPTLTVMALALRLAAHFAAGEPVRLGERDDVTHR
ncbi:FAD-dependent oxidoreductase [Kineococcus sp. GCM10028916]|uniref:FAD-dependent oxidoreductase n=1 Tax=Kineococcus sp. GCM10028916 TaxID=3273394 RepID=UPI003624D4F1